MEHIVPVNRRYIDDDHTVRIGNLLREAANGGDTVNNCQRCRASAVSGGICFRCGHKQTVYAPPKVDCYKCFSTNLCKGVCQDCGTNQDGPINRTYGLNPGGQFPRRSTKDFPREWTDG
jgi:hypothetical protein